MASDPFDDLLGLEDNFYKEGYDAGLTDGEYAGIVEGKIFGIEKGFEKAIELGRLHGRALVWQTRQSHALTEQAPLPSTSTIDGQSLPDSILLENLKDSRLPKNSRLTKHIEGLIAICGDDSVAIDNSDEAVTNFDDRVLRAQTKAKIIAAIAGEPLRIELNGSKSSGIEESTGLNARH